MYEITTIHYCMNCVMCSRKNCFVHYYYVSLRTFIIIKMLRGVRQLRELVIRYSDYDGSSKGIREWVRKKLYFIFIHKKFKFSGSHLDTIRSS